jgi:hypothetical protein
MFGLQIERFVYNFTHSQGLRNVAERNENLNETKLVEFILGKFRKISGGKFDQF